MQNIELKAKSAAFVAAALLMSANAAQAQGHAHPGPNDDPTAFACEQDAAPSVHCGTTPTAAFDRSGRLWVAFAQAEHVYVSSSANGGSQFRGPVRVNDVPEALDVNGENRPKIAFGHNDEIYVTWTKKRDGGYNGDIRFSRSLDRGETFERPVTINDDGLRTGHRFESLHVDPAGNIYIAWLDKRDLVAAESSGGAYVGAAVYYTLSMDGGATFAANRPVAAHSCECCRIAMASAGSGVAIFWRHVFGDMTRDHAFAVLGPDGMVVPAERATYDDWQIDACPHHGPAMTPAGDGSYHLAWFTGGTQRKGIYYGRYTPGSPSPLHLESIAPSPGAGHPSLAKAPDRLYLAWKEFDGVRTNVNLASSNDGGETWSAPTAIAWTDGASDHPFLLTHAGNTVLSWHTQVEGLRILPVSLPAAVMQGGTP